ncbi:MULTISPECIES: hypothetical protein [Legionella]|uniref:Acid Phosphatase n=1 Tax=Legionella maceachernii TaxID=466 RepID=A0A0W0WI06_9GAMM|nr:hypothetical protein [Legionella maceachernii]KTD31959.1 Acid Phosphatase [Legionella maceachernii]SKA23969.1 Acid Phosphatase [Legionella maceachernii]SUP04222.1 epoxide hydrolase N-terminal domain-like phosphatase [Legionella maceachernii]
MAVVIVLDFDGVITKKKTRGFVLRTQITKERVQDNIRDQINLRNAIKKALVNGIPVAIASHATAPTESTLMKMRPRKKVDDFLSGKDLIQAYLAELLEDDKLVNKIIIEAYPGQKTIHLQTICDKTACQPSDITFFDDDPTNISTAKAKGYQTILVEKNTNLADHIDQIIENALASKQNVNASEKSTLKRDRIESPETQINERNKNQRLELSDSLLLRKNGIFPFTENPSPSFLITDTREPEVFSLN